MPDRKLLTLAVPAYNAGSFLHQCLDTLVDAGSALEVLVVNDGSKDNTLEVARAYQQKYPDVIVAVDQQNRNWGGVINHALELAKGEYFYVVDSDDWLDRRAMEDVMAYVRSQVGRSAPTDLVIANYVYEKVHESTRTIMHYRNVFPEGREFGWSEVGHFNPSQYLLMHSVIYRTELLRGMGLQLPKHTFYVDNIFVYVPLPHVKTIYYLDVDMYRYFIGRDDQSVNESVMMGRIDQQLRVTRIMIDSVQLPGDVPEKRLERYMENYLSMMMCICSIFLRMINTVDAEDERDAIWRYLKENNSDVYRRVRHSVLNMGTNLPTNLGRKIGITGYHVAQRIFKFN